MFTNKEEEVFALVSVKNNLIALSIGGEKNFTFKNQDDLLRQNLSSNSYFVFVDAKNFIQEYKLSIADPKKIICLSTIKKILNADIFSEVKINFEENFPSIRNFFKNALKAAEKKSQVQSQKKLIGLEQEIICTTIDLERNGFPFNKKIWQKNLNFFISKKNELGEKLKNILPCEKGFKLFGDDSVDLNNHAEVKKSLEELLGIILPGTSASDLSKIDHEAARLLLSFREHARMEQNYGANFLELITKDRIYARFNPIGSASGRFSCSSPNLMALPKHKLFVDAVRPNSDRKLIYFDYSGFELRILAALSGDKKLLSIFNSDQDIHSMVAEEIFGCTVSKDKNDHLRNQAKIINFGIVYGMGERALANALKISENNAKELLKNYYERFKGIKDYLYYLEESAIKTGLSKTILNRILKHSGENPASIRRIARNMPIQGSGADCMKLAMIMLRRADIKSALVNMVHDELVFECESFRALDESKKICRIMNNAFNMLFPKVKGKVSASG